jgi:hypothetical protein
LGARQRPAHPEVTVRASVRATERNGGVLENICVGTRDRDERDAEAGATALSRAERAPATIAAI